MLNVSIVLYRSDMAQVNALCQTLLQAALVRSIYLIDNSPVAATGFLSDSRVVYRWNGGNNLGYGRANNIAIRESIYDKVPFHLVINSDIEVSASDLDYLHGFMQHNPKVGSLMPRVVGADGHLQYLCKLLPTPWDVFARRFLPRKWTERRNARYELRASGYDKMMNVPYLSGCFMLLRTEAVLQARLFDERYFMYPEDIDLTRTLHRDWLTLYVPDVTIVHRHAQASYHSCRMLWVHIVNMCRYFNKWGWFFDSERTLMNQLANLQIEYRTN